MIKIAHWIIISIFLFPSISAADVACPADSIKVDAESCVTLSLLKHQAVKDRFQNQEAMASHCNGLQLGNLQWRLPKVNMREKNRKMAEIILAQNWAMEGVNRFMWLGLRRYGPKNDLNDVHEWLQEHYWRWVRDNTTLDTMKAYNYDFWKNDEPNNKRAKDTGDWSYSEDCVVFEVNQAGPSLEFHDYVCDQKFKESSNQTKINVTAIVCEYIRDSKPKPPPKPWIEQWWFYLICALMVVVPIAGLVALHFICRRRRKSRPISPGNVPRRHGGKRSPKTITEIASDDSFTDSPKSFRIVKSPFKSKISVGTPFVLKKSSAQAANKNGGKGPDPDEEEHAYSNVLPPQSPASKKSASKKSLSVLKIGEK